MHGRQRPASTEAGQGWKEIHFMKRLLIWAAAAALLVLGLSAGNPVAGNDGGEVWLTSQGTSRLFILDSEDRAGSMETVTLPPGTGPHITTFSPDGQYAYMSGMGNGDLVILHADTRQVVATLKLGSAGTHQAKPSPDGSTLIVAQIGSMSLVKVAADTAAASWSVANTLSLSSLGKPPICTVFRDDGARAYVSLLPDGIAIVDVATMTLLDTLPTDGFVACGMIKSHDGGTITIAAGGSGGHFYRLDTATDALTDAGVVGAADWHSFNMSPNQKVGFGTSPRSDQLFLIDLEGPTVTTLAALALDPTPDMGNDQPDAIAVRGDTVFVSLRASGKLAVVKANQQTVTYLDISAPAEFNPANCAGCAVHGVTVRP
jgi:DNA-binding beta-propeller fold protein YncE